MFIQFSTFFVFGIGQCQTNQVDIIQLILNYVTSMSSQQVTHFIAANMLEISIELTHKLL